MLIIELLCYQSTDKLFFVTAVPLGVMVELHLLTNCTEPVDSSYQ